MIQRGSKSVGAIGLLIALFMIGCSLKLSFIHGSWIAFFSYAHVCVPLFGFYAGMFGSLMICAIRLLWKVGVVGGSVPDVITAIVPGLTASLFWAMRMHRGRIAMQIGVPLVAICSFVLHPIGVQAWPYALYWLLPIMLYGRTDLFSRAFSSTFISHAVGSVCWLYAGKLSLSAHWIALIPLVAVERTIFALLMVGTISTIALIKPVCRALYERFVGIRLWVLVTNIMFKKPSSNSDNILLK